jgi:uncharacterized protein YecA (UPF0149 family)
MALIMGSGKLEPDCCCPVLTCCCCLQAAEAAVMALSVGPGELKTETVEEFISISDGQVRAPTC